MSGRHKYYKMAHSYIPDRVSSAPPDEGEASLKSFQRKDFKTDLDSISEYVPSLPPAAPAAAPSAAPTSTPAFTPSFTPSTGGFTAPENGFNSYNYQP